MLSACLTAVRSAAPIIHTITNYVTANDCANVLLAVGASAIMTDDPGEVEDVARLSAGLVLNTGTMHADRLSAMLLAGNTMNALGRPIVLDPVGAGASAKRTETALLLVERLRPAVIRANLSEIRALALGKTASRGVDSAEADASGQGAEEIAMRYAREKKSVVIVTGAEDMITDGTRLCRVFNGHAMMRSVTGSGCMLSALTGAFSAANPERIFEASVASVCAMGICGEIAFRRLRPEEGNASYRNHMIDAVFRLTPETLKEAARYELQA